MRIERGLAYAIGLFLCIAVTGWFAGTPRRVVAVPESFGRVVDVGTVSADSIASAARVVVASDPFRFERRPASVAYRPELEGVASPPKPPKPQLVLDGLVGSAALLDGVPGRTETAIVHVGDTLGGLRIRRIARDTVLITGADTAWRLTLRHIWQ